MGLILKNVDKIVGRETHLKDICLSFEPGSRNVLLGRTLAGKTSLLRIMAGLDRPTRGRVVIGKEDVTGVSVRKRSVSMVYQQFVNYPSLTIYKNIASPLKIAGMAKTDIDRKVLETAKMLHIDHLLDRLPAELSGGQQQRTAIARALVRDSQLLLLDEPLVNLDYKLREELRVELQEIFNRREAIVVYTTTEPAEALMIGGNMAVIDEGRVLQTGSTTDVYNKPASLRVAEIFSDPPINYLNGVIKNNQAKFDPDITIPLSGYLKNIAEGRYKFGVRSNHLFLEKTNGQDIAMDAVVELCEINGSESFIYARYGESSMVVQVVGISPIKIGSKIQVFVNPDSFFVYDENGLLVASPAVRSAG